MTVRKIKSIGDIPYPIDVGTDALSPLLTAGAALGITGDGPTDSAAWLQRTSTSDGPTTAKSIHGRTLRWNQHAPAYNSNLWVTGGNAAIGTEGTALKLSTNGTAASSCRARVTSFVVPIGHKVYIAGTVDASHLSTSAASLRLYVGSGGGSGSGTGAITVNAGTAAQRYSVMASTTESNVCLACAIASNAPTTDYALFKDVLCIDLTAMFGAGNEPSNVAEFEALYPESYYPYDAGSLLPVNMAGIETEDADGNPLQTRTIHAGTLRGAGSVFDELTETERITRIGEVDLGTLTWAYNANGYMYASGLTPAAETVATQYVVPNATCVPYEMRGNIYVTNPSVAVDKTISINSGTQVRVRDSAYTDPAVFKTAMSGVMLHYALATPTVTPYDPPLNLTYRTAQGGTERVMVPTGELSAPPTIVTAQGYTAESLRDAALSAIAHIENGTASTNYAVGSYLVHGGQLCKVTTAIATGEAITIGTNVTATTVMAEILSLVQ